MPLPRLTRLQIAIICHELNRAYAQTVGDFSHNAWEQAPDWQKYSAISGVEKIAEGVIATPEQSHESWMQQKLDDGWTLGSVKNETQKTHPSLLPFAELPESEQAKDLLFFTVASTLLSLIGQTDARLAQLAAAKAAPTV